MTSVILLIAHPRVATGETVEVRLAGGGADRPYPAGFRAGLANAPRFRTELAFDANGWTGKTLPATAALVFRPAEHALLAELGGLVWADADIVVDVGPEDGAAATVLTGKVATAQIVEHALVIEATIDPPPLGRPLLTERFAGTGGIEGGPEAEGRLKRRSWGRVWNVEGRVLDKATNVFEFGDPARTIADIVELRDKGRMGARTVLSWQGSIAATLAALKAATPPAGGGVVAPSIACAKWWTQPSGPLTADLLGEIGAGYVETAPEIAARIVAAAAGPAIVNVAAIAAIRPDAAGLHVDDAAETGSLALDRLLYGVSLVWTVTAAGAIELRPLAFGAPAASLRSIDVERRPVLPPTAKRRVGFRKSQRLHNDGEIAAVLQASDAFYADGTPLEALKPAAAGADPTASNTAAGIYGQGPGATASGPEVLNNRQENSILMVRRPEGGAYSHTSGTATGFLKIRLPLGIGNQSGMLRFFVDIYEYEAGGMQTYEVGGYLYHLPPTWNSDWINVSARMVGGSGAAKPVTFGHDGANYCVFIGSATTGWLYPQVTVRDFQIGYLGMNFGWDKNWQVSVTPAAITYSSTSVPNPTAGDAVFGVNALESWGGALATIANFKTALGTAAAFTGQQALATQPNVYFGSGFILEDAGGAVATLSAFKTGQGISAGFQDQGILSTLNGLAYGSPYLTGFSTMATLDRARLMSGPGGIADENNNYWVTNALAITSLGTAAALYGQGWGATASEAAASNAQVRAGANIAVNGDFTRGLYGWSLGYNPYAAVLELNLAGYFGARNLAYLHRAGATSSGDIIADAGPPHPYYTGGTLDDARRFGSPAVQGDRIYCRALMALYRCTGDLYVLEFDASGSLVSYASTHAPEYQGGAAGNNLLDISLIHVVGSAATVAVSYMVRAVSNGGTNPYLFFGDVAFGKLPPGQQVIPPYAPGRTDPLADRTNDQPVVQWLDPVTGRVVDGRALNSSNNFGLRSLAARDPLTDTPDGGSVIVNIPAATYYTDWGTTIVFPSASVPGLAYNTRYFVWRIQGSPISSGTGYGISTSILDALGTGKVYLDTILTRANAAAPPPPPPPPPPFCVAADALVHMADGSYRPARLVASGDVIVALSADRARLATVEVEANRIEENELVEIETEGGARLRLAYNTPMERLDGRWEIAANAAGSRAPVRIGDRLEWQKVVAVRAIGRGAVAAIKAHDATFAASVEPGAGILSHNEAHKP